MGLRLDLSGMGDLLDEVEKMAAAPAKAERGALKAAAQPVLEQAKRNLEKETPHHAGETTFDKNSVDTGKLQESGEITGVKKDEYGGSYVLVQFKDPVAHLVEEGHGGPAPAPAHPFLRTALAEKSEEAAGIMADTLKEAL